jgi:hypothetical protein
MFVVVAFVCTFAAGAVIGAMWTYARFVLPAIREADLYRGELARLTRALNAGDLARWGRMGNHLIRNIEAKDGN